MGPGGWLPRSDGAFEVARALVAAGADLSSTNGEPWRHTPLHQAAYHGRYEMAKTLVELGARHLCWPFGPSEQRLAYGVGLEW